MALKMSLGFANKEQNHASGGQGYMQSSVKVFEYFPDNYSWNMAVLMTVQVGGEMSEIEEACRPLRDDAPKGASSKERQVQWFESWCKLADRVRGLADRDRANGHSRSAARKYHRACLYYMAAERQMSHRDPRKMQSYDAMLDAFRLSMELSGNPVEFVDVPYEKTVLPSLYVAPPTAEPGACMIVFDGFDVSKEWAFLSDLTTELSARNIGCLHVDHPGCGAALRKLKLSAIADIERAATACVDWLSERPEIDPKRIGIIAPSLGGYYAFRSAAFEPRLACAVAHGARWDNDGSHGRILRNPGAARSIADWLDHAMWYYGTSTEQETAKAIAAMSLEGGVAERIRCPVLVAHGGNDRQVPLEQATTMVERAINSPRRDLKVFDATEGGIEHCGVDNMSIQIDYMADWIAEVLAPAR
jgi:dienelactone hydrolase